MRMIVNLRLRGVDQLTKPALWTSWKTADVHPSPPCQHRETHDRGLEANSSPQTVVRSCAPGLSARCGKIYSRSRGVLSAAQVMLGQVRLLQLLYTYCARAFTGRARQPAINTARGGRKAVSFLFWQAHDARLVVTVLNVLVARVRCIDASSAKPILAANGWWPIFAPRFQGGQRPQFRDGMAQADANAGPQLQQPCTVPSFALGTTHLPLFVFVSLPDSHHVCISTLAPPYHARHRPRRAHLKGLSANTASASSC
jgi:hypothetical protein